VVQGKTIKPFDMQKKILVSIFCITFSLSMQAQDKVLPVELRPYVLQGYEMLDVAKGDLNGDNLVDYILILKTKGEDTLTFDNAEWEAARPLLLIIRQPGGGLKSVASNTELILCRQCGGAMGDPYMGMAIKKNEFSVEAYGGSSWRWSETVTFRYDKLKKNWYLQKQTINSFQAGDPETTTTNAVIDRTEIGAISLSEYSPGYNTDTSKWKVNVAKTFFYESPNLKSTSKKAYLLKGDVVKAYKAFRNFIECSFNNSKGNITTGYILRKDLVKTGESK
jgi:hypothetical protein